jgi:hypothetical protein
LTRFPLREVAGTRGAGHARALLAAGHLATFQRDFEAADGYLRRSLAVCEQLEDQVGMCDALYSLHSNAQEQGDYAAARPFLERGVALSRTQAASARGDQAVTAWQLGMGLMGLGMLAAVEGDARAALDYFQQSSQHLKRIGQPGAARDQLLSTWPLSPATAVTSSRRSP